MYSVGLRVYSVGGAPRYTMRAEQRSGIDLSPNSIKKPGKPTRASLPLDGSLPRRHRAESTLTPRATLNEEGGRSHEEPRRAPRWGRDTPRNRSLLTLPPGACAHAWQGVGLRRNRPRGYLGGVSRKGLMRKPRSNRAETPRLEQGRGVGLAHNANYRKQGGGA